MIFSIITPFLFKLRTTARVLLNLASNIENQLRVPIRVIYPTIYFEQLVPTLRLQISNQSIIMKIIIIINTIDNQLFLFFKPHLSFFKMALC